MKEKTWVFLILSTTTDTTQNNPTHTLLGKVRYHEFEAHFRSRKYGQGHISSHLNGLTLHPPTDEDLQNKELMEELTLGKIIMADDPSPLNFFYQEYEATPDGIVYNMDGNF